MTPVFAIIGRPNVGKSTLFNALTRTRDALVADFPGLTRDRKYGDIDLDGMHAHLVDTGGMFGEEGLLTDLMDQQIGQAMDESHLVLFVVSARDGLIHDDREILKRIRNQQKPVLLIVNKSEGLIDEIALADFYQLGIKDMLAISSAHRKGMSNIHEYLCQFVYSHAEEFTTPELMDHGPKISIIGRPNVGKSTLVNRLLREERVVTFDLPGTTRDSISLPMVWDDKKYTLVDTAGVRRRSKIGEGLEKFSILKTIESIELSNICALLLDAQEGITDQDLHLLGLIGSRAKAVILVVNKWDHLSEEHRKTVKDRLHLKMMAFEWVPVVFISALHGSGLRVLIERIDLILEKANQELSAKKLTNVLIEAYKAHQPPLVHGLSSQLKYAHSGGKNPVRVVVHGKRTTKLPAAYKKYLENVYRKAFSLKGVPIVLQFIDAKNPFKDKKKSPSELKNPNRKKQFQSRKRDRRNQ